MPVVFFLSCRLSRLLSLVVIIVIDINIIITIIVICVRPSFVQAIIEESIDRTGTKKSHPLGVNSFSGLFPFLH